MFTVTGLIHSAKGLEFYSRVYYETPTGRGFGCVVSQFFDSVLKAFPVGVTVVRLDVVYTQEKIT